MIKKQVFIVLEQLFLVYKCQTWGLYELRKGTNLSQDVLSKKLGFPQTTYSQYESGKRKPTTMKLLVVAQYYNVSFDYLVGRSQNKDIKLK